MQKISTFLWFDKDSEEAMNYYVDTFNHNPNKKAESKIVTIQRYPQGGEGPMKGFDGKVLTGVFELEGQRYMCLDGGPIFKFSEAVSLLVDCKDQAEIDYFWNRLNADPNGGQCGWCKDKFGFSWQIVPDMNKWLAGEPEKSKKAMHVMLGMKKIIIKDLEDAYNS